MSGGCEDIRGAAFSVERIEVFALDNVLLYVIQRNVAGSNANEGLLIRDIAAHVGIGW